MPNYDLVVIGLNGVEHGTACVRMAVGGGVLQALVPLVGTLDARFACLPEDQALDVSPTAADAAAVAERLHVCRVTDPDFASLDDPSPTLSAIAFAEGGTLTRVDGTVVEGSP